MTWSYLVGSKFQRLQVVPFKCQLDVEVEVIATEIIKSQWPITKDRPQSKVKVFTAWIKLTNPKCRKTFLKTKARLALVLLLVGRKLAYVCFLPLCSVDRKPVTFSILTLTWKGLYYQDNNIKNTTYCIIQEWVILLLTC